MEKLTYSEVSHQVSIDKYFLSISYEYRRKDTYKNKAESERI